MKRFIIALLLLGMITSFDAAAQLVVKKRIGTFIENGNVTVAEAHTMLAVDLTIQVDNYVAGPYAKYAERMLGCQARKVDSKLYTIVEANVSVVDNDAYLAAEPCRVEIIDEEPFPALLPDRMSATAGDAEKSAKSAADQIFALRTARLELITAELGDGVYGAGLESALREIERLEREYTELFLGKRSSTTLKYRYFVPVSAPEYEKVEAPAVAEGVDPATVAMPEPKALPQSHIVARFNDNIGMLSANDQRGDILLVTINPTDTTYPESNIKGKAEYRYANNSEITLSLVGDVLVERILPIYEYGKTVKILAPTK